MASHTSDDTTRVVTALRALVQLLRTGAGEATRRTGLSSAQLFILSKLADAPAPSVNALARRVHAHQSSVSVVVELLVRRALVARAPDPADRRRRTIALTPKGRTLLRRAPKTVQSDLVRAIAALPTGARRSLRDGLERVVLSIGGPVRPGLFLEAAPADQ
ncbi:MAG TPA: MarR family transcriptional regulator [Gemmatimonadales bacterium]|nr:MarR family transcriptional regulator [Gemmatimonadales bacterium]